MESLGYMLHKERDENGMFGDYQADMSWSQDGAGLASLPHPNEFRKKLYANSNPTFVQTKFQQPHGYDDNGNYYHQDGMQSTVQDIPVAEVQDEAPADTVSSKRSTRKKKMTIRKRTMGATVSFSQGGGGGPRQSRAVKHASLVRRVQAKHAPYPKQEFPFRGGYPALHRPRFGMRITDDNFDPRFKHAIAYKSVAHPNNGNDHNHYLPFLAQHTNHRPTAHQ
jgi:hypothetical protein